MRGDVSAYWTVYDGAYELVVVADTYLRGVRFGSGKALGTTRMYADNLALFFEFCLATGRSLRTAAFEFDRFVHYLAVTLIERRGRGQGQLRSPERVNHVLGSVRELYREAVAAGALGALSSSSGEGRGRSLRQTVALAACKNLANVQAVKR